MPAPGAPAAASAAASPPPPPPPADRAIRRIAVFCGSRSGARPAYAAAAAELGREMARRGIRLTYGGGTVGLMGVVAHSVLDGFAARDAAAAAATGGGAPAPPPRPPAVLGFIPALLAPREVAGAFLGDTHVVADMHARKAAMAAHCDAFVALPGGLGTLEEIFEAITWAQLGYHQKPTGFLDTNDFYAHLSAQIETMVEAGFVLPAVAEQIIVRATPAELVDALEAWRPPSRSGLELHAEEVRRAAGAGAAAAAEAAAAAAMGEAGAAAVGVDISRPSGAAEE